jgi:hypothetical protein
MGEAVTERSTYELEKTLTWGRGGGGSMREQTPSAERATQVELIGGTNDPRLSGRKEHTHGCRELFPWVPLLMPRGRRLTGKRGALGGGTVLYVL